MRAVVCKAFGPPENLVVETVADPVPGEGEVVVDVRAVAVTFPDTLIIQDLYQFKGSPPFIPGTEAAGVVSAVGDGVNRVSEGDDVVGWGFTGGFAERVAFPVADLRPMPRGLDYAEATGFGYAYGTSYYGLKFRGGLQPGETLLVLGAAGSLGLATIELGKLLGAKVIAAASTPEKLALCRERGADETINYDQEDLKGRVKELTGGQGVDVAFDSVGGDYADAAFRVTNWRGRYLVIGFTAGIPRIPLNLALLKGSSIVGVFWGAARTKEPELFEKMSRELDEHAAAGDLRPLVSRRCTLEEVPQALRDIGDRKALGKIVAVP
ncbi:MAG TPA: NADPH:quinone oxidoreductase family protein [Acidobacteriota bacterium]|nr:NADPH:quinone oxidoreductase family protein [Acidobacteriota bacterium]